MKRDTDTMKPYIFLLLLVPVANASGPYAEPYTAFDPPRITPSSDTQTVKAGASYGFRCTGGSERGGVSWRLPVDATEDLRSRVRLTHTSTASGYVSELSLSRLVYSDTGSFVCTYNGTVDTTSIDNSTRVHLYVEDDQHLVGNE